MVWESNWEAEACFFLAESNLFLLFIMHTNIFLEVVPIEKMYIVTLVK